MDRAVPKAARDGDLKKAVVGAAVAGGALAAVKLGRDRRLEAQAKRRFRLRKGEPVPEGLGRIAGRQLDVSIERLEGETDEDLGTSVHEVRKSLKRLRAIVRLARDELGDEVYRRENTAFRDAGRRLSGARDSRVLVETLDAVTQGDPARARRVIPFRRTLVGRHAAAQRRLRDGAATADVLAEVRDARTRVEAWPLERQSLDALAPGFERIYRRGRRAHRSARRDPSTENLHELRKRVKDLWYAAQIVRPASPKRMKRLARDAHELSDMLGEDHDLAVLRERANERRDRFEDERAIDELAGSIESRRDELQRDAMRAGARVFRKKPRKITRQLEK